MTYIRQSVCRRSQKFVFVKDFLTVKIFSGNSVVEGEFRIINQNFWRGLEDPTSEEHKAMAQSVEREVREALCLCVRESVSE